MSNSYTKQKPIANKSQITAKLTLKSIQAIKRKQKTEKKAQKHIRFLSQRCKTQTEFILAD